MDFPLIMVQAWCTLAALLIGLLKSSCAKGRLGELLVRMFAHWQLDKQTYPHLRSTTLIPLNGVAQNDQVSLSPNGIFVLKTKNMGGWIFGSEKQALWATTCYKRAQTPEPSAAGLHAFQNPRGYL